MIDETARIFELNVRSGRARRRNFPDLDSFTRSARDLTGEALGTLIDLMGEDCNERTRLAAACELLNRAWGKSREHISVNDNLDNAAEINERLAQLDAELAKYRR